MLILLNQVDVCILLLVILLNLFHYYINLILLYYFFLIDVEELYNWHVEKCDDHPYFRRLPTEELLENDPATLAMTYSTEESKKVDRVGGKKYIAVYERLADAEEICKKKPRIEVLW